MFEIVSKYIQQGPLGFSRNHKPLLLHSANVVKLSSKCLQNVFKMSSQCLQARGTQNLAFPQVFHTFRQHVFKMSPKCPQNVFRRGFRFFDRNMLISQILFLFSSNMHQRNVFQRFSKGIFKCRLDFCRTKIDSPSGFCSRQSAEYRASSADCRVQSAERRVPSAERAGSR